MKAHLAAGRRLRAMTLAEILVVVAIIGVLLFLLLPSVGKPRVRATRIKCVNNLKNVGLAARIYAADNNDQFPFATAATQLSNALQVTALDYFLTLSNELSTPKIIFCPDDAQRVQARDWITLKSANISYFVNVSTTETNYPSFLAGDRNLILNGKPLTTGAHLVTTNDSLFWTTDLHKLQGNIAHCDGSVQQYSSKRLNYDFRGTTLATNVFLLP